jgi:hypothetical protein
MMFFGMTKCIHEVPDYEQSLTRQNFIPRENRDRIKLLMDQSMKGFL